MSSPRQSSILIIGGGGFVGLTLANKLCSDVNNVVCAVDLSERRPPGLHDSADYRRADMMNVQELHVVLKEFCPRLVIVIASWGMSGSGMLDPNTRNINVNGIKNVISSCKLNGIYRLIYTSSYNVIYGGAAIENGSESMDYWPIEKHTDYYSSSKAEAEKAVLGENGSIVDAANMFLSAVIRPAAIYGEGEMRHFPRIVKMMDSGLFTFVIGKAIVDWVHIENLVQAFEKLAHKLLQLDTSVKHSRSPLSSDMIPSGQAYFISDGSPINNFEFFRPIFEARDVDFPTLILSKSFMLKVGYLCEKIHLVFKKVGVHIEPFVSRAEVLKVGETHYFSIDKAKTEIGFSPTVDSISGGKRMAKYYSKHFNNSNFFRLADLFLWVLILFGMGILYHFAHSNTDYSTLIATKPWLLPMDLLQRFSFLTFRSQDNLKIVFDLAVITHVFEAVYATYICIIDLKCRNTWFLWSIQTFFLGYGSLQYLRRRLAFVNKRKEMGKVIYN